MMDYNHPELRVSDAEREQVATALRQHGEAGRLDVDELADRLERAYAARTGAELAALVVDLPPQSSGRSRRAAAAAGLRHHFTAFAAVNLGLIGIWAASGGGEFWPIWPLMGWGLGLGCHARPALRRRGVV